MKVVIIVSNHLIDCWNTVLLVRWSASRAHSSAICSFLYITVNTPCYTYIRFHLNHIRCVEVVCCTNLREYNHVDKPTGHIQRPKACGRHIKCFIPPYNTCVRTCRPLVVQIPHLTFFWKLQAIYCYGSIWKNTCFCNMLMICCVLKFYRGVWV